MVCAELLTVCCVGLVPYQSWIQEVAALTVESFNNWEVSGVFVYAVQPVLEHTVCGAVGFQQHTLSAWPVGETYSGLLACVPHMRCLLTVRGVRPFRSCARRVWRLRS